MTSFQLFVVGCALWVTLHRSHTVCIAPRWITGPRELLHWALCGLRVSTDSTCAFRSCQTRRQPAPRLHKDVSTSFCLGELRPIGGVRYGNSHWRRTVRRWKQTGRWAWKRKLLEEWGRSIEKVTSELYGEGWVETCQRRKSLPESRRRGKKPDRRRLVPEMVGGWCG